MLKPFFVWQNKVLKRIDPAQVMCLETIGNYTKVVLSDRTYFMIRSSLSGAIKKLPPEMFIKINRSLVTSIYFIDDIDRYNLVVGGLPASIGKGFYKAAISQLNIID